MEPVERAARGSSKIVKPAQANVVPAQKDAPAGSLLERAFRALHREGVLYAVLRDTPEGSVATARHEIDVLVARNHWARLADILETQGFCGLPSWGHAPHSFFVAYDPASGCWFKFDVVTELCYGRPLRYTKVELTDHCLNNRQWQGGMFVLAPEEEFVTLLLHCLLDKLTVSPYASRLTALWQRITCAPGCSARLRQLLVFLEPELSWETLAHVVETQEWQVLLDLQPAIERRLARLAPIGNALRWLSGWLLRRLRPVLLAVRRRGLAIALLGPDGAGKSTLACQLAEDPQLRVKPIYMGTNRVGDGSFKVERGARRLLRQWYRLASARLQQCKGRHVVFDRFLYDFWLNPPPTRLKGRLRRWLLELGWPTPDLAVVLDAPGQVLYRRKREHSPGWLEEKRLGYRKLRDRVRQLVVVDATQPLTKVQRTVTALVWQEYARRSLSGAARPIPRGSKRQVTTLTGLFLVVLFLFLHSPLGTRRPVGRVVPVVETEPVPSSGDAADDPAIWVHPADPTLSTILGTDKKRGLAVYDLSGRQLQFLPDGRLNNVDVRQGLQLGGLSVDLVTAGNRSDNSIAIYRVDRSTRKLENVAARKIITLPVYGSCMYRSGKTLRPYYFVNSKEGDVQQWELLALPGGKVDAKLVRAFSAGTRTEGCVADDRRGYLYLGLERMGIRRYGAEPTDGVGYRVVDTTRATGHLRADVEGLALYRKGGGGGYLIASSQGSSKFVVYRRDGDNAYVATFAIAAGDGIDSVTHTDGIEVWGGYLGPAFPSGVFVAQDHENDRGNQNFKLVPWHVIQQALENGPPHRRAAGPGPGGGGNRPSGSATDHSGT